MSNLDSNYFSKVSSKVKENNSYTLYDAVGHPMILRSVVDGRYLAGIHVFYGDEFIGTQQAPILTELDRLIPTDDGGLKQRYQVVFPVNKDDDRIRDGRPIKFVITNLCDEGYIKIDFMKNDKLVDCVDPGAENGGLNQINEIRPLESCEIAADQTNKSRQIMIKLKTKTAASGLVETVNLDQEITAQKNEQVGDYLWITVTPRVGIPSLIESFKETVWTTDNQVIVKTTSKYVSKSYRGHESSMSLARSLPYAGSPAPALLGYSAPSAAPSRYRQSARVNESHNLDNDEESVGGGEMCFPDDNVIQSQSSDSHAVKKSSGPNSKSKKLNNSTVMQSKVAGLTHGDILRVNVGNSGVDYHYHLRSPFCLLGMSFLENLEIKKFPTTTQNEANTLLDEYFVKLDEILTKKMLDDVKNIKKFQLDECVICVSQVPTMILLRCGHICACKGECSDKLDKCPMCRSFIVGKVDNALLLA